MEEEGKQESKREGKGKKWKEMSRVERDARGKEGKGKNRKRYGENRW